MNTETFFKELDNMFETGSMEAVEPYLRETIRLAGQEGDSSLKLAAENEMVGYLRSLSRYEEAVEYGKDALGTLKGMGLGESVHAATTMLNTATAMRGLKKYEESAAMYKDALVIYEKELPEYDYRIAGLYNNMSILYENMKDYEKSKLCTLKAIDIISRDKKSIAQLATSYTNVAQVCFQLKEYDEAFEYMQKAEEVFEENELSRDSHYGALLATMGQAYYLIKEYDRSLEYYERAIDNVKTQIGENDYYFVLKGNYEIVQREREESKKQ